MRIATMSVLPDPVLDLPLRRLRRLARRAHRARLGRPGSFEDLAAANGLPLRSLRLLADAWAAGGESGIEALAGSGAQLPEDVLDELDEALESWRRQSHPLETLQWEVRRNRVAVRQVVPGRDRLGPAEHRDLFQLRRTPDDGWHLYRTARGGEWWPVVVTPPPASLQDCLDAVRLDVARQFWPAPPAPTPRPRA